MRLLPLENLNEDPIIADTRSQSKVSKSKTESKLFIVLLFKVKRGRPATAKDLRVRWIRRLIGRSHLCAHRPVIRMGPEISPSCSYRRRKYSLSLGRILCSAPWLALSGDGNECWGVYCVAPYQIRRQKDLCCLICVKFLQKDLHSVVHPWCWIEVSNCRDKR